MSRPVAVRKALPLAGLAMGALRGVGTKVATKVAEKGVGGALKEGAKAAVANTGKKDLAVGVMKANNQISDCKTYNYCGYIYVSKKCRYIKT